MSIYIKGMEMPKACVYRENGHLTTCPLYDVDGYCGALNTEASHKENGKLSGCPLVEIPPHGRLIDADALAKDDWYLNRYVTDSNGCWIENMTLEKAPTIIPAEEADHA